MGRAGWHVRGCDHSHRASVRCAHTRGLDGDDLIEESAQVAQGATFKFNGGQPTGGRWAENGHGPSFESAFGNGTRKLVRNVADIRVALHAQGNGSCFNSHVMFTESKVSRF